MSKVNEAALEAEHRRAVWREDCRRIWAAQAHLTTNGELSSLDTIGSLLVTSRLGNVVIVPLRSIDLGAVAELLRIVGDTHAKCADVECLHIESLLAKEKPTNETSTAAS